MAISVHCAHDKIVPLSKLKPHPGNPNKHPPEQIALLAKVIAAQGWRNPIVVSNRSGLITKGHARREAALALKCSTVPVDYQDYATESEELADMIADNRIAELAEADRSMLRELAEQLDDGAFDMDLTGFDHDALEELMTAAPPDSDIDAEPQIDKAEELRAKWGVERGQIWELGEHRIMCGDSTNGDVRQLVEKRCALCFTSPPYAEQRKDQYGGVKESEYWSWFKRVQSRVKDAITDHGHFVLNIKPHAKECQRSLYVLDLVSNMVRSEKWLLVDEFVWLRTGIPQQVVNRFKNAFEPCYWFAKSSEFSWFPRAVRHRSENVPIALGKGAGDTNAARRQGKGGGAIQGNTIEEGWAYPSNVLDFRQNAECLGHPAAFPPRLPRFFIECMSETGENIYDPFSGSGTTIIACEQLGRKCRAMEIDPGYVAVSIQRWADATGKTPKLLNGK